MSLPTLPPPLPAFAHIRRHWDVERGLPVAKLSPGEFYVTCNDELIFTVLGSCVSACLRERILQIGGMNHFMLPLDRSGGNSAWNSDQINAATRFGNVAMERLINEILKLGGRRENLEFKIIGGGKVLDMALDVGARNVEFVQEYLRTEGFAIMGEDTGDCFARKLYYSPKTGKVRVKRLTLTKNLELVENERRFSVAPAATDSGTVELF